MNEKKPVLVTGSAGFIGYHLALRLLKDGHPVVGMDNLNDYYDVNLKKNRLKQLQEFPDFHFHKLDLYDRAGMEDLFNRYSFETVVNLAAQAGVRYSLTNPHAYVDSNLLGFINILEGCRHQNVKHLVFASSSSVYGANTHMPFSVHHNVDHPVSLYAATKKANELMAHTYAHLYGLPCTGLRFFTVYGPWGRPDMALFLFTRAILEGKPIKVFNEGKMRRDFTYIDDIIEGVVRVIQKPPKPDSSWSGDAPDPGTSYAPYRIYNIGNNKPVELMDFITAIENCLGITAEKELLPLQPGDVPATYADIDDLKRDFGFHPRTSIQEGISRFVEWYRSYYGNSDFV
ncbi:NAD-dependent epimerase [Desulforhabdus amnigena]|jgi:UDP-glucuronate 4-epimerase|uniref:NAD-dependent epimerase n=1 Tax=Desulforhabdus amnigena TaxID=40218 RepID=A0A9W6FTW8_9BACT|nr:NAD-dependent epimerase [Desulforhabdus amnigena]NLJ26933.1 NAD-dependent epimerase [Deltaproteobacteria bacterium]GLI34521.1 NAD-dependent epimerase [Desulforhabdus amnigena]